MKKFMIRADGNSALGFGHLMRMSTLSKELRRHGKPVSYCVREEGSVQRFLEENGEVYFSLPADCSLSQELSLLNEKLNSGDVFVADLFPADAAYLNSIRKGVFRVLIDNLENASLPCELYHHGAIYGRDFEEEIQARGGRGLLGSEYALMREQFRDLPKRKLKKDSRKILVTMGGADPLGMTEKVVRELAPSSDFVTVVIGGAFSVIPNLSDLKNVQVLSRVSDMMSLMMDCDLCVSAGGTTTYELAATGTPSIVYRQAENQNRQCETFHRYGSLIDLGDGNEYDQHRLKETVEQLFEDFDLRQKMSERGQRLVDGYGAERTVNRLLEEYEKREGK